MVTPVDELLAVLDLERLELNLFRGISPANGLQRVFGGQVAAQALTAAGRTVERGTVHSLHAYFLRPGDPSIPIVFDVDRIRDGRSFTTRRVVALQRGEAIFTVAISFHVSEAGLEHQPAAPQAPPPESLPRMEELLAPVRDDLQAWDRIRRGVDLRYITPGARLLRDHPLAPRAQLWFRVEAPLPDDPLLHACIAAFVSDMSLIETVMLPHDIGYRHPDVMVASLDHAMWFHRPFRVDEWLLYDQEGPTLSDSRGLALGRIHTAEGRHVVTVAQEGLIRQLRSPADAG